MISSEDLDTAVTAGVLDARAAEALRAHVARLHQAPAADEEHFRLVTGFNDIFVVIASLLLLVSLYWIGSALGAWVGALALCAASWGLAEYFVRRRRMALPAIVLLITFVGAAFAAVVVVAARPGPEGPSPLGYILAALVGAGAAWAHWRRFQVPITVAAGALLVVGAVLVMLQGALAQSPGWLLPGFFLSGLAVFALAVWWDASDPARTTRRADVAFWLHLLAAPLLVHPVFNVLEFSGGQTGAWQAGLAVALYLAIGAVSLVLDRRALMVSALGYVLYAFSVLLEKSGFVDLGFAVTALGIGLALLLLSAFWQRARQLAVRGLPERVRARLAPIRTA